MPDEQQKADTSAMDVTIPKMLEDVAKATICDDPSKEPTKMVVIALYDNNMDYKTALWNYGCSITEAVALLEVEKYRLLKMLHQEE